MRRERDLSYGSNYYGVFLHRMSGGKDLSYGSNYYGVFLHRMSGGKDLSYGSNYYGVFLHRMCSFSSIPHVISSLHCMNERKVMLFFFK